MDLLQRSHLFKGPVFKCSHILRHRGLELQHMNWKGSPVQRISGREERKGGKGETQPQEDKGVKESRGRGGGGSRPSRPSCLNHPHRRWCQLYPSVLSRRLGEGAPGALESSWAGWGGDPEGSTFHPDSHSPWWLLAGVQSPEGHPASSRYPKAQIPSQASPGPQAQAGVFKGGQWEAAALVGT